MMVRSKLDWSLDAGAGLTARPLVHGDLDVMGRLLAEPEVAFWYDDSPIAEQVAELGAHIESDCVSPFLVVLGGQPIGYIQAYHANRDPWWTAFGVPQETFGLDMFLAECRECGLGPRLTRAMIDRLCAMDGIRRIQIDPDPANGRAIRAYEKAGFRIIGVFPGYYPGEEMLYMTIET
ncbi:MAG: acetyltransferase [Alphaproteobacteria bacterium]|nr:acetyltransferase [Alphaproteobacteria bacterium]